MKFAQFMKMALHMTIEYYNRFVKRNTKDITEEDIYIEYTINNKEVLVSIMYVKRNPRKKYIVSYDKKTKKVSSYISMKIDDLLKKEEN